MSDNNNGASVILHLYRRINCNFTENYLFYMVYSCGKDGSHQAVKRKMSVRTEGTVLLVSLSVNSLTSCITHVTLPAQVHWIMVCWTEWVKNKNMLISFLYFLASRWGFVLNHHPVPPDHDSWEFRAGQTGCTAAAAGPRWSRPTCEQRDFPHHHARVDFALQPRQVEFNFGLCFSGMNVL